MKTQFEPEVKQFHSNTLSKLRDREKLAIILSIFLFEGSVPMRINYNGFQPIIKAGDLKVSGTANFFIIE